MRYFTINQDTNITLHAFYQDATATQLPAVGTQTQLAAILANDHQRLLAV